MTTYAQRQEAECRLGDLSAAVDAAIVSVRHGVRTEEVMPSLRRLCEPVFREGPLDSVAAKVAAAALQEGIFVLEHGGTDAEAVAAMRQFVGGRGRHIIAAARRRIAAAAEEERAALEARIAELEGRYAAA